MDPHLWLAVQKWNTWLENPAKWATYVAEHLPEKYVPRLPEKKLPELEKRKAILVVGPRQAGKSTFLWRVIAERHQNCLCVQLEDPVVRDWCKSPSLFAHDVQNLPMKLEAILFDEVQHLDNAGLFIKGLVDLNIQTAIYVTGSSSFHLLDRIRESLAGRATRLRLYPFSLKELLGFENVTLNEPRFESVAERIWSRLLLYGGFPDVYLHDQETARLFDLVEAFIMRDASDLFRIRKPAAFRRFLQLLATQIGNLGNFSEWAAICQVSSSTLVDYAAILEETHVIRLLPVFSGGRRAELTARPKVFFIDAGIRNLLVSDFSDLRTRADRGALFENQVFSELLKMLIEPADLHHWRTRSGAEVDFVLYRPGVPIVAIEAKLNARPGRISRGARSFIEAYQPDAFLTVTNGPTDSMKIGHSKCVWCRPFELERLLPNAFLKISD